MMYKNIIVLEYVIHMFRPCCTLRMALCSRSATFFFQVLVPSGHNFEQGKQQILVPCQHPTKKGTWFW